MNDENIKNRKSQKISWDNRIKQAGYFLGYFLKNHLLRETGKPLICSFRITGRCNLKCRHCPFWRDTNPAETGFYQAVDILKKLSEDGVRILIFEGGEPFIWQDPEQNKHIGDLVEEAKKLFFCVGITTNGTIDLKKANPDITFVSIDGLKDTHDYIRGETFNRIMENIERNQPAKKIIVNTCISKNNFLEIPQLIRFLDRKVFGITIQFFYPYPGLENLSLNMEQRRQVLNELIEMKKKGFRIMNSFTCLRHMIGNTWKCHDFLVASVEPDRSIHYGCYLKNKIENVYCKYCGFAVHCEISMAYRLNPGALRAARDIFRG